MTKPQEKPAVDYGDMTPSDFRHILYMCTFLALVSLAVLAIGIRYAHADSSISYSPTSPQVYDGSSDMTITCGAQGGGSDNYYWFFFKPDGTPMTSPNNAAWSQADGLCPGNWVAASGHTFQYYLAAAGIVTGVYADYSNGTTPANCFVSATASLSACLASPGFSATSTYELCDGSCGGGGGGGGGEGGVSTSATSSVDQLQSNVAQGYWMFFSMMVFVIWLGRRRV